MRKSLSLSDTPDVQRYLVSLRMAKTAVSVYAGKMAPGKKTREKDKDRNSKTFAVTVRKGAGKGKKAGCVKKSKEKIIPKKKLKNQTEKWIDNVNDDFSSLQPELTLPKEQLDKQVPNNTQKHLPENLKSDVTQEGMSNTIEDMARLL
ncbi:uncharacterized protein LOC125559122 [Nematostella vectensis]|uniref:uncharacterized protein LOC125559122 n=1 Tax=Nematostella vectensis TaxID=45351 RepID=UPI0020777133|nr:uncharacterized protein LOC125559122 [Nematostella vectensis]